MPIVYGVNASPFVRKVRVVLGEKGIPYELEPVIPMNVTPEFKRLSPLGKIPAFKDGDFTLADSSVICAYLERTKPNPPLYPSDPRKYGRALWFEEYGDTALAEVLTAKIFVETVVTPLLIQRPTDEAVVKAAITEEMPPLFDYLESQVGNGMIAGEEFSIGDIGIATQFVNLAHARVEVDKSRWPKLVAYVARVLARPSFKPLIEEEAATYAAR